MPTMSVQPGSGRGRPHPGVGVALPGRLRADRGRPDRGPGRRAPSSAPGCGRAAFLRRPRRPLAGVALLNTETRGPTPARRRSDPGGGAAPASVGVQRVYKKIDSVLRGHPGPELAAVLDVFGGRALVAPAFPAQGRTTPGRGAARPRPRGAALRRAPRSGLAGGRRRIDVQDALTDADLARVARLGAGDPQVRVWCARRDWRTRPRRRGAWHRAPRPAPATQRAGPLAEAGPRRAAPARRSAWWPGAGHEATARQLDALLAAGWSPRRLAPFPGGAEPEEVALGGQFYGAGRWWSRSAPGCRRSAGGAARRPPASPSAAPRPPARFGRALSPVTQLPAWA